VLASVGARKYRHFMDPPKQKTFDYKALNLVINMSLFV
jgi:hypothetical protein